MKISTRNKLVSVAISTGVFVGLAIGAIFLVKLKADQAIVGAFLLGLMISLFEVFYVQGQAGRWLRVMHPLKSLLLYNLAILVMMFAVMYFNHWAFDRWDKLPLVYAKLPVVIPLLFVISAIALVSLRIVGYVGGRNIFYLLIGKYHRPVVEKKVFLFLDMKGSTNLVDRLGAIRMKALVGKFLFDASKPITDNGGEIYRFTGDGFVAMWDWERAFLAGSIFQAVDDLYAMIALERPVYEETFGLAPEFRIGIHGGDIVGSEEGDNRRDIGFYGDTINIAARMEQKAKEVGYNCVLTSEIFANSTKDSRFKPLGAETVRGIERPMEIYGYTPSPNRS